MTPQVNRDYPVEITLGLQFETEPIDGLASARQLRCPAYHGTLIGGGKCLDQFLADRRPLGWPVQPLSRGVAELIVLGNWWLTWRRGRSPVGWDRSPGPGRAGG
jgi:hypothetical protein